MIRSQNNCKQSNKTAHNLAWWEQ